MISIDLSGKTALITGGGQGLGAETARLLHRAGANVAINYFPDEAGTNQEIAGRLVTELGEGALSFAADVGNFSQVETMIAEVVARFGSLDIVVNNAGIIRDRTLLKMSLEEWNDVIDINLTGVFHVCKAAAPQMNSGGRIVNMSALSAMTGGFGQSNYAAAKSGLVGFTKVLSRELGKKNITVNAVAPGIILAGMGNTVSEELLGQWMKNIALGRAGEAGEVSGAILFLCSGLATYVTGQTLHVNGGWYAP